MTKIRKVRKLKKKNCVLALLLILSTTAFVYSAINLIDWQKDNKITNDNINDINEQTTITTSTQGEAVNSENEPKDSIYWSYMKTDLINVDFTELKKKNSDTKGWIQVLGTNINYPFVQSKDNKYYLTRSFDKKYTDAGWVFLDYRNNIDNLSKNNIIYAHARKDKTMFGTLKNTLKKDWYDNKNNHIIKISTEKENTLWQVFSIYHIETENYYIQTNFNNDKEFKEFANKLKKRSVYYFNANISEKDTLLTLSTCFNKKEKMVLHAKLLKREKRN